MSGFGAEITFDGKLRTDVELFSESNGRWIVQVAPEYEDAFSKRFDFAKKIGNINEKIIFKNGSEKLVELTIEEVRDKWIKPIWDRLA